LDKYDYPSNKLFAVAGLIMDYIDLFNQLNRYKDPLIVTFRAIQTLFIIIGGIIVIRQFIVQNALKKINIIEHWDKRYMDIYKPITQDEIELLKSCPRAYSREGFKEYYKKFVEEDGPSIYISFIHYYRVYMHMVICSDIGEYSKSKLFRNGANGQIKLGNFSEAHRIWLAELIKDDRFMTIHKVEGKFYPYFCKYLDRIFLTHKC
jgi:hypothetical protein